MNKLLKYITLHLICPNFFMMGPTDSLKLMKIYVYSHYINNIIEQTISDIPLKCVLKIIKHDDTN